MSGGDENRDSGEQRQVTSPGRILGARSASPAKRSAADMEGDKPVPGSFTKGVDGKATDFDEAMSTITPATSTYDDMDTQETVTNGVDTSAAESMNTNTSATSLESEAPPPYSAKDEQSATSGDANVPTIDEQYKAVYELMQAPLDEGQAGYLVAKTWLSRVLSRTSENQKNSEYSKESRDGNIGPVDNSDLVPAGAFTEPILKDMENKCYIPLKAGMTPNEDFEILPYKAWGLVLGWYGIAPNQKAIIRYAHNTAPVEATLPNVIYEIYPPIITIRKVPQPKDETGRITTSTFSSFNELRLKDERRARGQMSPEDAIQFVSSRNERFNKFLKRSKQAANIPFSHKVRIFKVLDPAKSEQPNSRATGVPSPPESRSSSPKAARAPESKLVLDTEAFSKMDLGKEVDLINVNDETNNSSYNGTSKMEVYGLFEDNTIILEEMIGGPAGGEFASDKKKNFKLLSKKGPGSKPGSAAPSGRTSPAPGGIMTRGRQRRDGRTRGVVGLTNLGNTCYMNSALQCIRSIEELAIFFLSDKYKKEINSSNPLGHGGAMAKQYANFLSSIYGDSAGGSFTPSAFRKTLGSIQPMFSGYGQQDSQEFLSFLIDALHEDLNRIVKKPYNENPDSDDKTVHDPEAIIKLGDVYRANHKARNDSVAMDLFSGFYKNTMECPVCDKISITFDPYSLLTVQLPMENTFQHNITFIPFHGKPVNHSIDIDKNSTIKMLKEYIASRHAGVTADRLWMAEVYSHKLYKVFDNAATLAEANIQNNDYLFIFELEAAPSNLPTPDKKSYYSSSLFNKNADDKVPEMDDPKGDRFAVPVFSRSKARFGNGYDIIMHPMYVTLTRDEAKDYEIILKKVLIAASRMTNRSILAELDEDKDDTPATNGDLVTEETMADDSAQISDRSVPSEDGFVEVSVDHKPQQANGTYAQSNGAPAGAPDDDDDRPIPPRFMDPDYFLSAALRNQLFALNYAPSESGNVHCTGMTGFSDRSVRNMYDRVKQPVRRGSVQSESSGEESTTSTGSGAQANGELEESDEDELDKPDLVIGGESTLTMPSTLDGVESEDETLPDQPWIPANTSRKGRRKQNKHGKNNRDKKMKTYGKRNRRGNHQNRPDSSGSLRSIQSHRSLGGKSPGQDENQFYIKLGEGIVIDWLPDAYDALFGGSIDDEDDTRGVWLSHQDGKGIPLASDPEVEAKKKSRETRKKHGISLDDCFRETGKREVLSEDNAWYCNRCKEMRRAAKTLEIWTIPDILVVHLKRFGGNRSFRDKIDVFVDYPIEGLDMTDRIGLKDDDKEYMYDLFAVDNHYGGLGGGHYTAMAKNFYDGQWYDYNDSSTSKLNENRAHSAAAYLLFYRRRSDKPLGPPALQDMVLDARNPQTESAAEETAEESDAGEGQLGGPNGSQLGSSSGLIGAGAGATTLHGGDGGTGAGLGAGSNLMTRMNPDENPLDEMPTYGPQRPANMLYGHQGSGWDFGGLANPTDDATTLIDNIEDEDDVASTVGQIDHTDNYNSFDGQGYGNHMHWSAAQNTPIGSDVGEYDEHDLYSSAHGFEHEDNAMEQLHLADAGNIGGDADDDPETVEIHADPPDDHEKMD